MKCQKCVENAHLNFPEPSVIYYHKWHREAANPHIYEAKPGILFTFLFTK